MAIVRILSWNEDKRAKYQTGSLGYCNNLKLFETYFDSISPQNNPIAKSKGRWMLKTGLPLKIKESRFKKEELAKSYADKVLLYFWTKITLINEENL